MYKRIYGLKHVDEHWMHKRIYGLSM